MRPKIVILFVILPTIIVLLAVFLKIKTVRPTRISGISSAPTPAHNDNRVTPEPSVAMVALPVQSSPVLAVSVKELSPEERQSRIYAEIDRLNNAYVVHDEASKALIVSDLTNSEPEVRAAAVEAVKQLDDRSLIPVLIDLATNAPDYEEHHALLAAADFLSMPTLDEAQKNWTPGPNSIPVSTIRQTHHRHSAPSTGAAPDNSANSVGDQPNVMDSAVPISGN
jgi:hypothetical protein